MNIKSNNSFVDINIKNTVQGDLFGKKNDKALPFLRWAGGKRWLKKSLHNYLPKEGFKTYHEPFIGGGSILFHLQPEMAYISDLNEDLINIFSIDMHLYPYLYRRDAYCSDGFLCLHAYVS